jgi:hypothetical protein
VTRAVLVAALALWPAAAAAVSLTLTDGQRQEALRTGERSVTEEALDGEWSVKNGAGERAVLMSPFHRLAVAARHATFSGKPLKPTDPDKILKENRDRLVFWVDLRGTSEDFARYYVPRLMVGDREIKASFVQNERTAARQPDGGYLARCVYGFPTRDVKGGERVGLIVGDGSGRDVSQFTFDLARMR